MPFPAIIRAAMLASQVAGGGGRRASLSGGGAAPSNPGGGSNLGNRAAAALGGIQYANAALDKWMPGVTTSYQVTAQGGPQTSPKNVLHTALAIAFGLPTERRFASFNISVGIDHRANTVTVHFAIGSLGMIDLLTSSIEKFAELKPAEQANIASDILLTFANPSAGFVAIVAKVANAAAQQNVPVQDIIAQIHGQMRSVTGASQVWKMGVEDISAGNIPSSLNMGGGNVGGVGGAFVNAIRKVTIGAPILGDMTERGKNKPNALMLTRRPEQYPELRAANGDDLSNPQPSVAGRPDPTRPGRSIGGIDLVDGFENLRTLVTQVLADPGIRPPKPTTQIGPPSVEEMAPNG